jgi:hypothetical protein
MLPRLNP